MSEYDNRTSRNLRKKTKRLSVLAVTLTLLLVLAFRYASYRIPILKTGQEVGNYQIYYIDSPKMILCDIAYFEIVVFEDENFEYYYNLQPAGSSCLSNLFIWDGFRFLSLKDAVDIDLISRQEFIDSEVALVREKQ